MDVSIREARPEDVEQIFDWIAGLAEYERAREQVTGTPEMLEEALFGPTPAAEALVAEVREGADPGSGDATENGMSEWQPAGFALFHSTFSTWECRAGIWLEDLYVPPEHRRTGVGAELLKHLAGITVARGYPRLEWVALDWNEPALNFYAKIGARRLDDWIVHRLDRAALARVAGEPGSPPS